MEIADHIRRERRRRGWTQHQLAARTGVPDCYISFYETGHRKPSIDAAAELAQALEVSLDRLVFGAEQGYLPYAGGSLAASN